MKHTLETGVDQPTGEDRPVSRVRTDIFCRECGANLYEQPVWRTAEARLLVVRCPRCGAITSANAVLPYRRIWRQRLGVVLTLGWLCVLGLALVLLVVAEFSLQIETTRMQYPTAYRGPYVSYFSSLDTTLGLDRTRTMENLLWTAPGSLLVAFAGGCLLACAVYHWPLWGHLLAAPIFPAAAVLCVFVDRAASRWEGWTATGAMNIVLAVAAVQLVGGVLGAMKGRAVVRGLLRLLLPNRSRQFFAFLWRRDGKEMPVGPF